MLKAAANFKLFSRSYYQIVSKSSVDMYLALEGREEQINFFKKILYILYIFRFVYMYIVVTVLHTFQPNPQDSLRRLLPFLCLHYS